MSVTLQSYAVPARTPVKIPVALVTPSNVYDNGADPPLAVRVTVPVPALQSIAVLTAALAVIAVG